MPDKDWDNDIVIADSNTADTHLGSQMLFNFWRRCKSFVTQSFKAKRNISRDKKIRISSDFFLSRRFLLLHFDTISIILVRV